MTNRTKRAFALILLEGIIVFTAIPLVSAVYHSLKGLFT
jgi:hypothetical protein